MNPAGGPLRILQVNSAFSGGGADRQTLELAAGLRDLGQRVVLAVPAGSAWEPLARQQRMPVETFPERSPLRSALIRALIRVLRTHRTQIIHAHQGRDYWPAIIAARLCGGVRVVVTRHLMTRPAGFSRWTLLRMADVIAVSRAVEAVCRQDLRGPPSRVHQVFAGIDTSRFLPPERTDAAWQLRERYGWPKEAVVFGVVGVYHLPRGKGQLEFLEAAGRLNEALPQTRFAIVGSGTMESLLRETITRLKLDHVVGMLPFGSDIPIVMNALDVLVHPAVGTEAFPLVVLEALASGRPVIASRLNGIPETFNEGEHGLLVPPGDVPALAGAMRALVEDPELRHRFGAAGPGHVQQNYSRPVLAKRTLAIYERLCIRSK
jgi:glycosyltransferase involved in cell wall biosynthesis